jgi:pantothenate kinase
MLVRDIYGCGYESIGLSDDIIASSLGKATRSILDNHCSREALLAKFKQEDIVKSILLMICYDVSQIASLYARLYKIDKVFFGGYFTNGSELTMKFLKHGVSYWSQVCIKFDKKFKAWLIFFLVYLQNQIECLFLRHEGYLGAIGAFLKADEESGF